MKHKLTYLVFISLLLSMFVLLLLSARSESLTYDEQLQVNAGYSFLFQHDFRADPFNPPLARELIAIPAFFNKNLTLHMETLFIPRLVVMFFSLGLGSVVFFFAKKRYGIHAAFLALFLFIFEPNILANGHYATTDLIFTFFYVLTIYLFALWRNSFNLKKIILFGIIVGLLLSTKTTALAFLFLPLCILYGIQYHFKVSIIKKTIKKSVPALLIFFLICLTALWGTYFFKFEPPLGYRYDIHRPAIKIAQHNIFVKFALDTPIPLGSYISTLKQIVVFNYSGLYLRDSMLFGVISHKGQPGYFFIPLILIKTPLPLLILFGTTLILLRKKISEDSTLLVPLVSILILVLFTNTYIVYRYILPIVPLLIIYTSQIVTVKVKKKYYKLGFGVLVVGWYLIESFSAFPHYISYVNLVLGGYKNGYKYVFDANYDWGQGLIGLKNYQNNNKKDILQLAYYGQDLPSKYGIHYERLKSYNSAVENIPESKLSTSKNTIIAISASCWYLCGYNTSVLKNIKPTDIVGGSILIFKF